MLDSQRALGGNVAPGDSVSAFFSVDGRTHQALHDVRVSRVQGGLEAAPAEESSDETAAPLRETGVMVTLVVSAANAERVVYAAEHGTIWLSNEPTDAVAIDTLLSPERAWPDDLAILRTASEELGQRRPLTRAHGTARSRASRRLDVPGHRAGRVHGRHPGLSAGSRAHARTGR